MIFPIWHPALEFFFDPGKKKNTLFHFHYHCSPVHSSFFPNPKNAKFLSLSSPHFFFLPQAEVCRLFSFIKSEQKWFHFLAENTLFGSLVTVFSISGYYGTELSLPWKKTYTHTHTHNMCVKEKYWAVEIWWLFLISV